MPSFVVGNPLASGPQIIVSGNPWSGFFAKPIGGIQLRADRNNSGVLWVGLSGDLTVTSGGMFLSGGGFSDGMPMYPGDPYFIPRIADGLSGNYSVYVRHDAACSGQGRLYYEIF